MIIAREITVSVYGKAFTVKVIQRSKSVWIASGEYLGESYSTQGRTDSDAATAWQRWASYKGNG